MGYSPIANKSPIDQTGKNIWEKSMVFFPIISIYLNGTNYGEPAICQCCKMSMMQNDNDAKCQWYIYVNVAKCQCLQNDNIKNRKCSATVPTLP